MSLKMIFLTLVHCKFRVAANDEVYSRNEPKIQFLFFFGVTRAALSLVQRERESLFLVWAPCCYMRCKVFHTMLTMTPHTVLHTRTSTHSSLVALARKIVVDEQNQWRSKTVTYLVEHYAQYLSSLCRRTDTYKLIHNDRNLISVFDVSMCRQVFCNMYLILSHNKP